MLKAITVLTTAVIISTSGLLPVKGSYRDPYERAGISEEEFYFISSVVEAESDRSESLEGRILIAEVILNRVNSPLFPDTISGVLNQSGQFSTVVNGHSITERTDLSDEAVIQAIREIESGEAPEVLFFNCIGYNYGTPYGYVDGNYFMTYEEA